MKGSVSEGAFDKTYGGMDIGLTYAMGSDTIIVQVGNLEEKVGKDDKPDKYSWMEVGYNTTIGPAALKVGYGTQSQTDADGTAADRSGDGATSTDIEVLMSISF